MLIMMRKLIGASVEYKMEWDSFKFKVIILQAVKNETIFRKLKLYWTVEAQWWIPEYGYNEHGTLTKKKGWQSIWKWLFYKANDLI